jgi:hypothetical protein
MKKSVQCAPCSLQAWGHHHVEVKVQTRKDAREEMNVEILMRDTGGEGALILGIEVIVVEVIVIVEDIITAEVEVQSTIAEEMIAETEIETIEIEIDDILMKEEIDRVDQQVEAGAGVEVMLEIIEKIV